jgi:uncharacterized protein YeaO (DUF488 family)
MNNEPPEFTIMRVYDPPEASDGIRVLVDRLWPRGLTKERAKVDVWLKDISPSHELRRQFHGNPRAWPEFVSAYRRELQQATAAAAIEQLRQYRSQGPMCLLYAARDPEFNNAVALKLLLA